MKNFYFGNINLNGVSNFSRNISIFFNLLKFGFHSFQKLHFRENIFSFRNMFITSEFSTDSRFGLLKVGLVEE